MCTVTIFALGDRLVFTSNRDEALARPQALVPTVTKYKGKTLLFPKDPLAGGTWFAVSAAGSVAVLLNGAFKRHIPTGHYRKSRGLVLLDIIAHDDPAAELTVYDLHAIEPFTLLLYDSSRLIEFRWDGDARYFKEIDLAAPCIYSSATLYTPEIISQREEWFEAFLHSSQAKNPLSIRDFHASAGRGDAENGLVMSRGNLLKTQSITQAILGTTSVDFNYHDLVNDTVHEQTFFILQKA